MLYSKTFSTKCHPPQFQNQDEVGEVICLMEWKNPLNIIEIYFYYLIAAFKGKIKIIKYSE